MPRYPSYSLPSVKFKCWYPVHWFPGTFNEGLRMEARWNFMTSYANVRYGDYAFLEKHTV